MVGEYFQKRNLSFKDKIFALDYSLIFLVLFLGVISFFAMYSTERGVFNYYTLSHIYRFSIFFILFIFLSFFKIEFWNKNAYIFYFLVLILLFGVDLFGVTASGSRRWINLFIFNLQPSELMKIALIIFLTRYYYKIPSEQVTNLRYILTPVFALFIPVLLVASQPDLGTAVLIMIGGLAVIWLTGVRIKFFLYSFFVLIFLFLLVYHF